MHAEKYIKIAIAIVLMAIAIFWIKSCVSEYKAKKATEPPKTENTTSQPQTSNGQEALVLMFDGYTTCSPSIDYKFELDTQGDPIYAKFPGISEKVYYSGKGKIKVPPRSSGPVTITSADPKKEARVRIWKVVRI